MRGEIYVGNIGPVWGTLCGEVTWWASSKVDWVCDYAGSRQLVACKVESFYCN